MRRPYFSRETMAFLEDLRANNNSRWFQANKARYEAVLRTPLCRLVEDFAPRLRAISRHFVADPRPVGGSLFRIHRDTRFGRDKSPYKTWGAVQFRHETGKDVHVPGYYLHVEPGNVFFGCGVWHPDGETLSQIRNAVVEHAVQWKRIAHSPRFRARFALAGDTLKRAPRGYDPAHPLIDDLKRKDFIAAAPFEEEDLYDPGFLDAFVSMARTAKPFLQFRTKALNLRW